MKVYPKIPRYDHPVVPRALFEADDLTVLEKYDGSSFRFTCYDERYEETYPRAASDAAVDDGSIVFGTRRTIHGSHRTSLDDIDGALHRSVRCLKEGVDATALRTVHDEYGGPVIVYAENLVYSTLDYGFTERTLPALVGFDVLPYAAIETMTPPGDPYEDSFDGFVALDEARAVISASGSRAVHCPSGLSVRRMVRTDGSGLLTPGDCDSASRTRLLRDNDSGHCRSSTRFERTDANTSGIGPSLDQLDDSVSTGFYCSGGLPP